MAEIKDWKSNTAYDTELMQIPHYQVHPEMMPFVGEHYKKGESILLVGESHYIKDIDKASKSHRFYYENLWYSVKLPIDFPCVTWFTTRDVIHRFQVCRRSKSSSMFRNPAKAAAESWKLESITDSEVFGAFAFMNFFQRPAEKEGDSIHNNHSDNQNALDVLIAVISIIKPQKVIFLSKKSYEVYKECAGNTLVTNDYIDYVDHPTCAAWHTENGNIKFQSLLGSTLPNINFDRKRHWEQLDIEERVAEFFPTNECRPVRRKKHYHDVITYRLYGADNIYEIVFHSIVNGIRVGIGYRFDYKIVWVWNYDKKEYIDPLNNGNHFPKCPQLNPIYDKVIKFVSEL